MAKLKLETIILPKKSQILVTNTRLPVSQETVKQLQNYSHVEVLTTSSGDAELPDITSLGVIVHFAGFESTSLSETLSYTAVVYRLLQLAKSYSSQFILVLPNSRNHLYHSALSLVTQYSKNFPINYHVIEIDPKTNYQETAYEIVKKFIYRHPRPKESLASSKSEKTIPPPTRLPQPKAKSAPLFKLPSLPKLPSLSKKKIILTSLVLIVLVIFPYLLLLKTLLISHLSIACLGKSLSDIKLNYAYRCSQIGILSSRFTNVLDNSLPGANYFSIKLGLPSREINQVFTSTNTTIKQIIDLQSTTRELVGKILTNTNEKSFPDEINAILNSLSESLASLQTDIRSWYTATPNPSPKISALAEKLNTAKTLISKLQGINEDWDTFLGVDQKQTYLVLVQDNTEIRPSGGYIDSLILLSFENGNLTNTELITSQSADSQLNGQVEPPPDFVSITGSSLWYLRDSNWDPDFPVTAKRAAWFASKELNRPIDGVIAINQKTLAQLLKILGSVKVGASETEVSSTNLTEVYLANLNVTSQSILYEVTSKLIEKTKSIQPGQIDSIILSLFTHLENREIIIYPTTFNSLGLESAGWSGGLGVSGCRSQLPCITDYIFSTDTNIGINKADYYLNKNYELEISIDPEKVRHTHLYAYQNTSNKSVWPAGDYKNYLRLYFPISHKITSIQLDGTPLNSAEYLLTTQNGLQMLGISLKVPESSTTKLEIQTEYPNIINKKIHYQLDIPNQAGANLNSKKISINYPKSWFATVYPSTSALSPSVASPGLLRYNAPTATPIFLDLDIAPNFDTIN